MADREGLGNLPIFDTEIRTSRELIAQEAECLTNIWIGQCFFQWQIRFMIR